MANTLTLSGSTTLLHVNKRSMAGGFTPAGTALVLQVELAQGAGTATFSGSVSFAFGHGVITSGTLTPSGNVLKGPAKVTGIGGSLTFASALIRQAAREFGCELTLAGALTPLKLFNVVAAGVLTLSGTVGRAFVMTLTGVLGLAGNLLKRAGAHFSGVLTPTGLLRQGIGEAPCVFTLGELRQRVLERLDDDGTYYSIDFGEVDRALNAAQNIFALLTLCNEKTVAFSLLGGQTFYTIRNNITDYIVPLRVTMVNTGTRLRPITIHQLDGRFGSAWRATTGTPTHYVAMGYDLLAVYPQPAGGTAINITYAAAPSQLGAADQLFEIPAEQQVHLVDFAIWWLRLKEGGEELQTATQYLQRFIEAADKYGQFVRRRSYGQRYDNVPFDLASFDRGRLAIELTAAQRPKPQRAA